MESSTYPAVVRRSIDNLQKSGVAFSFQAVVTGLNSDSVRKVAAFAAQAGAKVLQVVPFEPVTSPISSISNDTMSLGSTAFLDTEINCLSKEYPTLKIEKFEELGSGSRNGYHCDIGMTKLFFLPNGIVHRCYKLVQDTSLKGKDLRQVSVAAAWHDPGFKEIIAPPRQAYHHSECYACSRFSNCNEDGRCIYQAWRDRGRYETKDRNCSGPYLMPNSAEK